MEKAKRKKKTMLTESKACLSERVSQFCKKFSEIPEKDKGRFILDYFWKLDEDSPVVERHKNEDLKIILSLLSKNRGLADLLLELGDQGVDITKIYDCIKYPNLPDHEKNWHPAHLVSWHLNVELDPEFNEIIDRATVARKEFMKRVRSLRGAVKLISNLKPIRMNAVDELRMNYPDFNDRLTKLQGDIEEVIDLYIKYAPSFSNKAGRLSGFISQNWAFPLKVLNIPKKTSTKSKLWNWRIGAIVDELKRIGFSDRQAYRKTMDIFNFAFPNIWSGKNNDPDLIRQRYSYHKKTRLKG